MRKKYKLKSSSYNTLLVLNILLYGLIFPCEEIVCIMDGIEAIIIYFIIGYSILKSFIRAKNSKIKKFKYYFKLLLVILYMLISIYIVSLTL